MEIEVCKDLKTGEQHQTRLNLRMSSGCHHMGPSPELRGLLEEGPQVTFSGLSVTGSSRPSQR